MYQITDEEFEKAQRIIDEYHRERQQQAEWDLEEDEPDDEDYYERLEEDKELELAERAFNCRCGAWRFNSDKTKVLHLADCICGAE